MNIETYRSYCLSKKGVKETYPFGQNAAWFKVGGKAFTWTFVEDFKMNNEMQLPFTFANMKCDPEQALLWREEFESVEGGWHQSKKHWNSVYMESNLSDEQIQKMLDHAYQIVFKSLSKKLQQEIITVV